MKLHPRPALAFLLLVLAAASSAHAAEPSCIARCRDMAARGELREGVNQAGCVVRVCQEEGRRLYETGEYEQAMASLDALRDDLDFSPSYHMDRGVVEYALGRFDAALKDFDISIKVMPEGFQAGAQRGHTLVRLRRFADARAQFEKLLGFKGVDREYRGLRSRSYLLGNIGVVDVLAGNTAKAKTALREALQVDGRNAQAHLFESRVLPALESGKLDADGVYSLVVASEDAGLGLRSRAEPEVQKVIASSPKFAESYFLAAELLRNTHRYEECERVLLGGERAIPGDVDLKAERLRCTLLKVGPTSPSAKPAIAELKRLAAANPDNRLVREILSLLDQN